MTKKKYKVTWIEHHENILWTDNEEEAIEKTQDLFDPRETLSMDHYENGTWCSEELSADSSFEPTQHVEVEIKK